MIDDKGAGADQMPGTIGRYQVKELIGVGAIGAVYKAFDPLIKRTLAIKTIRLDIPRQSPQYRSFIERFCHEARISGTLSHPNIVTLFDIGEEGGLPYLAMEYVEGETISSLLSAAPAVRADDRRETRSICPACARVDSTARSSRSSCRVPSPDRRP